MSLSPEGLDSQLGSLSLEHPVPAPQLLLLSSSLAAERRQLQPVAAVPQQAFFLIDESLQPTYTDEHPEPELLASSVGKEIGGRMIPSSLTISLLSLGGTEPLPAAFFPSPKSAQSSYNYTSPTQPPSGLDRKNSFNTLARHPINNHVTQQRLLSYHKFTSPPITSPADAPTVSSLEHAAYQGIPIKAPISVPDSPCLDPTLVGGLPLRFWLLSQTPPKLLATSLRNSRTQLYQMQHQQPHPQYLQHPFFQHQNQIQSASPGLAPYTHYNAGNTYTPTAAVNIRRFDSPALLPVQTPGEEAPMTPLYLSQNDGYFDIAPRHPEEEPEEDETMEV